MKVRRVCSEQCWQANGPTPFQEPFRSSCRPCWLNALRVTQTNGQTLWLSSRCVIYDKGSVDSYCMATSIPPLIPRYFHNLLSTDTECTQVEPCGLAVRACSCSYPPDAVSLASWSWPGTHAASVVQTTRLHVKRNNVSSEPHHPVISIFTPPNQAVLPYCVPASITR